MTDAGEAGTGDAALSDNTAALTLSPAERTDPLTFVRRRELSEVHLLLDNITSCVDKRLPIAAAGRPGALAEDWLQRVCEIEWPPKDTQPAEAQQAELLIRVKDHLNMMAAPASGLTIAFTHLVTQYEANRSKIAEKVIEAEGPSRGSLAAEAYPDLCEKAKTFRRGIRTIGIFLFVWLLITCFASWYIALGNAALAQREAANKVFLAADSHVREVVAADYLKAATIPSDLTPAAALPKAAGFQSPNTDAANPLPPLCPEATEKASLSFTNATLRDACNASDDARAARNAADAQIGNWMFFSDKDAGPALSASAVASVGILGTAILPVLYGILGAGAAVLRLLSMKMRLSLLAPRDLNLAIQQLALGAVMGACIGIFIAQPSTGGSASATVIGPVALSASALSFLAGFGVDAVFATLESVIARVFNVQPAGTVAPASTP